MLNFHASKLWKDAPIKIRSELADSRLMMQAYINQLKLGIQPIDHDETSLPMADIPDTLYFLYRHFVPGCQDMIPDLIGTTIEQFMGMLSWFRAFIGCFDQPHPDSKNLQLKAVTHAMASDLMDLIGRVMVFIDPTPKAPEDIDDNQKLLKECENIFIELSYLPPGSELENYFVDRGRPRNRNIFDRMTPSIDDTSHYDRLAPADLTACFAFVQERIATGSRKYLPQFFGAIIERLWYTASTRREDLVPVSLALGTVIYWFRVVQLV
ncbi:hypothetical protein RSOLAG22IIIB_08875 [Rhizoctonia solani]|uniref:Uncharacterized protein n=1 Tax=Rhizoctonia solani TaxID=456999 RepID=A0A0K6FV25_9AGAM|nr:hypothetical protein RSOLAG22IIIB_08875 [Rhizoctonia solani]